MRTGPIPVAATGLVLGWLADRAIGDPAHGHPVAGFGRLARSLERVAWRPARLPGVLHAAILAGAAGAAAALVWRLAGRRPAGRVALWSLMVWAALGGRSLERAAEDLAAAVESGDLAAARRLLPALAGRDPSTLGAAELC